MTIGTHITLPTTPFGNKLASAAMHLQEALNAYRELKLIADAYTNGGTNKANLEDVAVGIPAGDGDNIYDAIVVIKATIDVIGITTALAQVQG